MKLPKSVYILAFLFLLAFSNSYAQKVDSDSVQRDGKKNVVYGTVGFVPLYIVGNVSYERRIKVREDKFFRSFWLKASAGSWGAWAVGGPHFLAGLTCLTGSNAHHLELNVGFVSLYDKQSYDSEILYNPDVTAESISRSDYINNSLAGGVGYRFQRPTGGFVFRVGLSYPESVYLGFGLCF